MPLRRARRLLSAMPDVLYVIAVVSVVLNVVVTWNNLRSLAGTWEALDDLLVLQRQMEELDDALTSAEAGQRGYLLTGDSSYLEPYHVGRAECRRLVGEVADGLGRHHVLPGTDPQLEHLRVAVGAKLAEMEETIDVFESEGGAAALAMVNTDRGLEVMNAFVEVRTSLRVRLDEGISARRDTTEDTRRAATLSQLASAFLSFVMLTLAYLSAQYQLRMRHEALASADLQQSRLVKLAEVAVHLNRARDLPSMLGIVALEARRLMDAEVAAVVVHEPTPRHAVSTGPAARALEGWSPTDAPHPLALDAERRGDLAADPSELPPPARMIEDPRDLRNCAAVALTDRSGRSLGHVIVGDVHRQGIDGFDLLTLSQLGQLLTVATENLLLLEEMQRLAEEREHFMAMLGHELRNPLNAISGASQVLSRTAPSGPTAEIVAMLARQSGLMKKLVDDLLDVARLERGKLTVELRPVDLAALGREVADDFRTAGGEGHELLHAEIPALEIPVMADRVRLAQVVVNLLDNAVKFGGDQPFVLSVAERDGCAVLEVTDRGRGLDASELDAVFDRYSQGDARARTGLGLGLALARGIVTLHDGTIRASSEGRGSGCTFRVELPLGRVHALPTPTPDVDPVPPMRVLVVDDRPDARLLLRRLLEGEGHTTFEAASGEEGLATARTTEGLDAVLCDIHMGAGLDGLDVAAALRKRPGGQELVLIALTGFGTHAARRQSEQAGFDAHLTKPVDLSELRAALMRGRLRGPAR